MRTLPRLAALAVTAALPLALSGASASAEAHRWCDSVEGGFVGEYFFPAWKQNFTGGFCRVADVEDGELKRFEVDLDQTATTNSAGFDAGVGLGMQYGRQVDKVIDNADVADAAMSYRFSADGVELGPNAYWWMGPKTAITKEISYKTLDNNYECYVVDASSKSHQELVDELSLQPQGTTTHNGATYHHYNKDLHAIKQVFSIRDPYQTEGATDVNAIMKAWRDNGLVPGDFYNLGWKINFETSGAVDGRFVIDELELVPLDDVEAPKPG